MEIKGIIKQVAREGKAVQLESGEWYSHFSASTGFLAGESVKITYTDNIKGDVTYHNWKLIEPWDRPVEVERPYGKENYQVEHEPLGTPKSGNGYKKCHLSPEECRCRALECAIKISGPAIDEDILLEKANKFLEFIENRPSAEELGQI